MPIPMTSGGPNPNQETPLDEFSGSDMSTTDSTSSQTSRPAPTTGPTPMSRKLFGALQQVAAVVDGAGQAGERVVEGDQQGQRGERVEGARSR